MTEIDLHGVKTAEAMILFSNAYQRVLDRGRGSSCCLKVIHGYGSSGVGGDTKVAIRSLLKSNSTCADFVCGEDIDGNPGYTIVYPKRRLPTESGQLWDKVVEFCDTPKTQSDVIRRFVRRSSEPEVIRALSQLEQRGRLRSFYKNGKRHFVDAKSSFGRL